MQDCLHLRFKTVCEYSTKILQKNIVRIVVVIVITYTSIINSNSKSKSKSLLTGLAGQTGVAAFS